MTKRILTLFVLLSAVAYGTFSILPTSAQTQERPTATLRPSVTATNSAIVSCEVTTGIPAGRVNLRTCAGTACPVLLVLTEGQALTVIQPGAWLEVKTEGDARGWINSIYCKGKKHD